MTETPNDARLDDAQAKLAALDEQPVEEHPAAYDEVHRALSDVLADTASE